MFNAVLYYSAMQMGGRDWINIYEATLGDTSSVNRRSKNSSSQTQYPFFSRWRSDGEEAWPLALPNSWREKVRTSDFSECLIDEYSEKHFLFVKIKTPYPLIVLYGLITFPGNI